MELGSFYNHTILNFSGPVFPYDRLDNMIPFTSPTGSLIVSGISNDVNVILELTGFSLKSLNWTILREQHKKDVNV